MSLYVKVQNGVVIGKIEYLSHNGSAIPNIYWKLPQMKANGFYPVEMPTLDHKKQDIDYDNPEILTNKVKYKAKKKPLSDMKKIKTEDIKLKSNEIIYEKYPINKLMFASLDAYEQTYLDQMKLDVKKIVDEEKVIKENLNNAIDETTLDAVNTEFSEI